MGLIITLLLAALVGWVASMIMHTDGQMGWIGNIIAGLVGGVVGTWLLGFLSPATPTDNGLNLMGIIVGVVGACIAIFLWQLVTGRRAV